MKHFGQSKRVVITLGHNSQVMAELVEGILWVGLSIEKLEAVAPDFVALGSETQRKPLHERPILGRIADKQVAPGCTIPPIKDSKMEMADESFNSIRAFEASPRPRPE